MKSARFFCTNTSTFSRVVTLFFALLVSATLIGCLDETDSRPKDTQDTGVSSDAKNTEDTQSDDVNNIHDTQDNDDTQINDTQNNEDAGESQEERNCQARENHHYHNGKCIAEPILALAANHTCALLPESAALKCWGANKDGQLGIKNLVESVYPTPQPVLFDTQDQIPAKIYASTRKSCVITSENQVWCWGKHHKYSSSDPDFDEVPTYQEVFDNHLSIHKPVQLALSSSHSCLRDNTGAATCWGNAFNGSLGNNIEEGYFNEPQRVLGNHSFKHITTGADFTCALSANNDVYCWGSNRYGIIKIEHSNNQGDDLYPLPQKVQAVEDLGMDVVAIDTGNGHACAILADKTIRCWGSNNVGQLGVGNTLTQRKPIEPNPPLNNVKQLALSVNQTCVLLTDGHVKCAGTNDSGKLGINDRTIKESHTFREVANLNDVQTLVAGFYHLCAIQKNNVVSCWGYNDEGQIGDGTRASHYAPVTINLN